MFDKHAIKHDFSIAASKYEQHALLQKKVHSSASELASDYLAPNSLILDIGCGATPLKEGWDVIALDISFGMCAIASQYTATVNADAENLPFANASVDGVFSSLFLQWADNPKQVISEIMRVLKPKGAAIITCFVDGTLAELKEAFLALDDQPHVNNFITSDALYSMILNLDGQMFHFQENKYIEEYEGILGLMHSIKNIGATNKMKHRKKGLMTPRQLKLVDKHYDKLDGMIETTWNVLTMVIGKA